MTLQERGHNYPAHAIRVIALPEELSSFFPKPIGLVEDSWPPLQITYLGSYLARIACKSVVIEDHYVDREYIDDMALFYSRSLRAYPNYCYRLHFFAGDLTQDQFQALVTECDGIKREEISKDLQKQYLGFSVVRPLPGAPIGRTVLRTFSDLTADGERRIFGGVRDYCIHLAGFELHVSGLAFQQQDQGVSACATTALWSALHKVAPLEGLSVPTPATITESATRYVLGDGRSLPSAGLSINQVCEATRAAGLGPLLIQSASVDHDKAQILSYVSSGFPPVLVLQSQDGGDGHAVCAVGVKLGDVSASTDPSIHFRDNATALRGVFIHDDRLGPYAVASLDAYTIPLGLPDAGEIRTRIIIKWPGEPVEDKEALLRAIIVPVPPKLRLTVARMRGLGFAMAQACTMLLPAYKDLVVLDCVYRLASAYRKTAYKFGLSKDGLYTLLSGIALSRYIGVIRLYCPSGPLMDLLVDATETQANPSVLACVKRHAWPNDELGKVNSLAKIVGACAIV